MKPKHLLAVLGLCLSFASAQAETYLGGDIYVSKGNSLTYDDRNLIVSGSKVEVEEDASLNVVYMMLQKDNQSITNNGQIFASSITVGDGESSSDLVNYGDIMDIDAPEDYLEYGLVHVKGSNGSVTNYGNIMGVSTVTYGKINAMDGSSFGGIDIYETGSLDVQGSITMNGDLYSMGQDSVIIFREGGCINMDGGILSIEGQIILLVDYEVDETTAISKSSFFVNYGWSDVTEDTLVTVIGTNGETTRTLGQLAVVPEPATATLSLLALCGLAFRRRRK